MAVLFLRLLAKNIWIPEDMIPTRWSDFSFWESWWQGEKENLLQIIRSPMGAAHLNLLFRMGKTFVYGLGAIFLIVYGLLFRYIDKQTFLERRTSQRKHLGTILAKMKSTVYGNSARRLS